MADAARLNISPKRVTAKCQEECTSALGQTHEIGSGSGCSEPSKQNIVCDVRQNELQEICKASNTANEQLQSFSGDISEKSHPEQLRLPPEDEHNSSQDGTGTIFAKSSAHKHHLGSEHLQNEKSHTTAALSSCTNSYRLQSFSGKTENSLAEQFEQRPEEPHEDLIVHCQTGKPTCSVQISLEQKKFAFGTSCSEPGEEKHHFGYHNVQNEPLQTITPVSSCGGNDQLQSISQSVSMTSISEQAGLHPEDGSKTNEPTNNLGFGTLCSAAAEDNQHFGLQNKMLQSQLWTGTFGLEVSGDGDEILLQSTNENEQAGQLHEDVSKTLERTNDFGFGTSFSEPGEENQHMRTDFAQDVPLRTIFSVADCSGNGQLQLSSENVNGTSHGEQSGLSAGTVSKTCQTDIMSSSLQTTLDHINESLSGSIPSDPQEHNNQTCSIPAQNDEVKISNEASSTIIFEQSGPSTDAMMKSSAIGHLETPLEDAGKNPSDEQMESYVKTVTQHCSLEPSETVSKDASKNSSQFSYRCTNSNSRKKSTSRSLVSSDRVLRSKPVEKPEAHKLSNNVTTLEKSNSVADLSKEEGRRKKRKKKLKERVTADEFSRIRRHLRYFLNRISYEKSLIEAYSGEGWKGNSLEKLRPEKELERANSEILRRKLKIRDLFQRLDSLCAEGMFPESLFDSEGQIDSEDIFCAKCGSMDVSAHNDIILCDGACDRGFHQYCLEPPLLSEEIPSDEDGWLCPGCDCKVDCTDLLNDSQGTDLTVTDSWEKVFPEAAVAASAGQNQENNQGLPSDDSDDNDYDPDGPETEEEVQEEESSSDASEYASASDGLGTSKSNDEQYLGLPSDDSEDDDFNPDAPDINENIKQESSSSDFTSDSEDFAAALDDDSKSSENVEGPQSSSLGKNRLRRGVGEQISKRGQKRHSLKDELSLLVPGADQYGLTHVSGKRQVERLDYKKLHDETYGNVPTSSDEDYSDDVYSDAAAPRKRKKGTGQVAPGSLNGKTSTIKNGVITKDTQHGVARNEKTPRRTPRRKTNVKDTSPIERSPKSGSVSGRVRTPTYKKLGEAVTQRLYKSFKENQYPDRSMKESLAQELGVMAKQVSKWFENARHCVKVGLGKFASDSGSPMPESSRKQLNQGETIIRDGDHNGAQKNKSAEETDEKSATPKNGRAKPSTSKGRKRKCRSDHGTSDSDAKIKTPPATNSRGGRVTRRRKSVATATVTNREKIISIVTSRRFSIK